MDPRYPERMKEGVFFIRFAKLGRLKDTTSDWGKDKRIKKRLKKQRVGSMPVEGKILIGLNR